MDVSIGWWTKSLYRKWVGNHHFHPIYKWLALGFQVVDIFCTGWCHQHFLSQKIPSFELMDDLRQPTHDASHGTNGIFLPTFTLFYHWKQTLGGGNSNDFLFSHLFGEDEPNLTHIFRMGCNHQLEPNVGKYTIHGWYGLLDKRRSRNERRIRIAIASIASFVGSKPAKCSTNVK